MTFSTYLALATLIALDNVIALWRRPILVSCPIVVSCWQFHMWTVYGNDVTLTQCLIMQSADTIWDAPNYMTICVDESGHKLMCNSSNADGESTWNQNKWQSVTFAIENANFSRSPQPKPWISPIKVIPRSWSSVRWTSNIITWFLNSPHSNHGSIPHRLTTVQECDRQTDTVTVAITNFVTGGQTENL